MIYLDALVVKVRDGAHVQNRAAHIAVGVDVEGIKHVLGIWVQASEGAKFWAGVCAELANRGIRDVLIVCCDGLTGPLGRPFEAVVPSDAGRCARARHLRHDVRRPRRLLDVRLLPEADVPS